jgi:hypothetical protein
MCCSSTWADPKWKSVAECDSEWKAWADRAMPHYNSIKQDYDSLTAKYDKLQNENESLRSENESLNHSATVLGVLAAAVGIGIGAMCAFWLVRGLKRLWPISPKAKQLVFMVCGAIWIIGAAFVGVNNSDLPRYPLSVLFMVLVYSLPGLLFGGIGFWWFGKGKEKPETTAAG